MKVNLLKEMIKKGRVIIMGPRRYYYSHQLYEDYGDEIRDMILFDNNDIVCR